MCRAVGGVANVLTRPNLLGLEGKAAFGGFGDWGEWEKEEEGEDEREEKAKATGIADAATALVVATNL